MSDESPQAGTGITLEGLQSAMAEAEGKTPAAVLSAFLPKSKTVFGRKLIPLKIGHCLFLEECGHPLTKGDTTWQPHEIGLALYAFTRPSVDLFAQVEEGTLANNMHAFLDELPLAENKDIVAELLHHWIESRETSLAMGLPDGQDGKKKAAASAGS